MSIESKHGVDEPGYEPPKSRGERLTETGEKMQAAGNAMAALGGAIVRLVFFGFLLLVVVLIGISIVSSGGSASSSTPSASKTNCEHPSASEPCEGRALEEWHREHGETPLRVQDGEEAPDATEQESRAAKVREAEASNEAIREGERLQKEGAALAKPEKPSGLWGDQTREENEEAGCKYGFTARERPSGNPEYFCNSQAEGQRLQENRERTGE